MPTGGLPSGAPRSDLKGHEIYVALSAPHRPTQSGNPAEVPPQATLPLRKGLAARAAGYQRIGIRQARIFEFHLILPTSVTPPASTPQQISHFLKSLPGDSGDTNVRVTVDSEWSVALWFVLLSPLLGILVGFLALIVFAA